MAVKIVTDSTCDIPSQVAEELGITVVPIYVMFGDKSYRDRVDMTEDEFYDKLVGDSIFPSTSVPTPNDFAEVYNKLANETDEILSIHLTSKESGTYNSAVLAKDLVEKDCRIDVVDSELISMGFGLVVLAAAQEARAGARLEQVAELVRRSLPSLHILFLVDTLKYVVKGGRLSKPYGLLGTMLRARPLLTMRDGELKLSSVARTKAKAVERLYDFARGFSKVKEIAVPYTTAHDEAQGLADRIRGALPDVPIHLTRVGASLGTHAGPGAMGVAVWEA